MKKTINKVILSAVTIGVFALFLPASAYAHVTVKPAEVLPGEYQTFTTSVPNEKEVPVTAIKLVIPTDVKSVTPTVKQGWEITTKKSGEDITEINWTAGTIASGLRDEFTFSAKVSADEGEITWKAYQTYQDGSVVAWDQKPSDDHGHGEEKDSGPYSTTVVAEEATDQRDEARSEGMIAAYALGGVAIVIGLIALSRTIKN